MSNEKINKKAHDDANKKPLSERQKKLAGALRQNLIKRKQQQRERVAKEMSNDVNDVL